MQNYYNLSDLNYPSVLSSVLEALRYKICTLLYPSEPYTTSKTRFILTDITDYALKDSADVFNLTGVMFPFTAYSLGEATLDMSRRSFDSIFGRYIEEFSGKLSAYPWLLKIPMISFFAKASDYFRALQLLHTDNASKTLFHAPLYINSVLTSIPILITYEISKGTYAFEFQKQLATGKIYDVVHNVNVYFSDIQADYNVNLVDDIEVSLFSLEMQPIDNAFISGAPTILLTVPEDGSSGILTTVNPTITFDQPMVETSVTNAIEIDPYVPVDYEWNNNSTILTIVPSTTLQSGILYEITIGLEATSGEQIPLEEDFIFDFTTVSGII